MIEGEELMVDDKDYDRITKDSSAPEDSRSLEFLLYARSVAAATSDKLYRAVSNIVDSFDDPKVTAVPGGLKRIRRIVFKTATKYGCDFSKCRDMSRITVQVPNLALVADVAEALLKSGDMAFFRVKNRFAADYDAAPMGGYRDLQLMCLIRCDDGVYRPAEVQVNLEDFVKMKAGIDPKTGKEHADPKIQTDASYRQMLYSQFL